MSAFINLSWKKIMFSSVSPDLKTLKLKIQTVLGLVCSTVNKNQFE